MKTIRLIRKLLGCWNLADELRYSISHLPAEHQRIYGRIADKYAPLMDSAQTHEEVSRVFNQFTDEVKARVLGASKD